MRKTDAHIKQLCKNSGEMQNEDMCQNANFILSFLVVWVITMSSMCLFLLRVINHNNKHSNNKALGYYYTCRYCLRRYRALGAEEKYEIMDI